MDGKERRQQLIALLKTTSEPLTGTALARLLGVSRQVIVGDMAILRAAGCEIYATPQGYVLPAAKVPTAVIAKLACSHDRNRMAEELNIILDHGGKVLDVIVEHGDIAKRLAANGGQRRVQGARRLRAQLASAAKVYSTRSCRRLGRPCQNSMRSGTMA